MLKKFQQSEYTRWKIEFRPRVFIKKKKQVKLLIDPSNISFSSINLIEYPR